MGRFGFEKNKIPTEFKMASAAGLLSPGLVSLVKRAQQLREEMDEQPTKLVAMDANSLPRKNGLTCKACSLDVLSHEWHRKSTDALNNNLRPKSDCHGTLISPQEYRRYQVPEICSDEEEELEEEGGEEEENITISNENMENPEYFRLPPANKISPPSPGGSTSLKRSLSDYHNNVSRPPLPPKKLGRSPSGEIAN